ncbi:MAG: orotidine-5'-phosphate decarboxylase [Candidatus Limnocylindrales bacterium]
MSVDVSGSSRPRAAAELPLTYRERLVARVVAVGNSLCVGLDPDPASLPEGFSDDAAGIEAFARLLVEATLDHAAAYKANLAFFEALGNPGIAALERVRAAIPAGIPFIADAKRGDIGSTAARQAVALFDVLGADAVTVSPYLGRDAIAPLLERVDRFAYVLCRTSNPGAGEFQGLSVRAAPDASTDNEPLYLAVARRVTAWSATGVQVGLVVGATAPSELREIREAAPTLPFLVPGVGAQGGDVEAVLADGPVHGTEGTSERGGGLLVNISRGIASAALDGGDPGNALRAASERWAQILRC